MERRERVVLENMCMIRDGSKVLVEDKIGKDIRGIIFPGGHVEEHEPIVDSVIREIKEETGLIIEDTEMKYEYDTVLHETEDNGGAYVVFPWDIRQEFGKGRVKIHADFDGIPYDGSIRCQKN